MHVVEVATGRVLDVEVLSVESSDYSRITKSRYFFNWKKEREEEVYKLQIVGSNDILGLISIERIPDEWRIHVRLLTVSIENKGKNRIYERIIGNLLTFVGKIAIREYAELACVSLKPKSRIAQHYVDKYHMNITGMTLSIELREILRLIAEYDHGK